MSDWQGCLLRHSLKEVAPYVIPQRYHCHSMACCTSIVLVANPTLLHAPGTALLASRQHSATSCARHRSANVILHDAWHHKRAVWAATSRWLQPVLVLLLEHMLKQVVLLPLCPKHVQHLRECAHGHGIHHCQGQAAMLLAGTKYWYKLLLMRYLVLCTHSMLHTGCVLQPAAVLYI